LSQAETSGGGRERVTWRSGWPVIHEVRCIESPDSGRKVPSGRSDECRAVGIIRSGKHALYSRREVAVDGTGTIDVHVALGHIVKCTGGGRPISIARIARTVTARAILGGSKLVEYGVGISLARAHLLIDERLDSGHDGRGEGCSSRTGPRAGIASAGSTPVHSIGPAENIIMTPETIRSE
jgi:hypothetical protein